MPRRRPRIVTGTAYTDVVQDRPYHRLHRPVVEPADLSSLGDAVMTSLRERNVARLVRA